MFAEGWEVGSLVDMWSQYRWVNWNETQITL